MGVRIRCFSFTAIRLIILAISFTVPATVLLGRDAEAALEIATKKGGGAKTGADGNLGNQYIVASQQLPAGFFQPEAEDVFRNRFSYFGSEYPVEMVLGQAGYRR